MDEVSRKGNLLFFFFFWILVLIVVNVLISSLLQIFGFAIGNTLITFLCWGMDVYLLLLLLLYIFFAIDKGIFL